MAYPSANEFMTFLREAGVDAAVERIIDDEVPFAFDGAADQFAQLRSLVFDRLNVPPQNVIVGGSGRFGFSLDPDRWGAAYSDRSDVDVVVVSPDLFERAWLDLGRNANRAQLIDARLVASVKRHRQQLLLYGRMIPADLVGITRLSTAWVDLFATLGGIPLIERRDTRGHLWHCWDHKR